MLRMACVVFLIILWAFSSLNLFSVAALSRYCKSLCTSPFLDLIRDSSGKILKLLHVGPKVILFQEKNSGAFFYFTYTNYPWGSSRLKK